MLASLCVEFPLVAAGTDEERYAVWPHRGTWVIREVKFAPATAVAQHATNNVIVTVSTSDGAAGAATSIGSFTSDTAGTGAAAFVVGTTIDVGVSGAGLKLLEGYQIKIAKTEGGTGEALDGSFSIMAEKVA